jgi:uroporphyrinogen III methyltransferase/synthase
VVDVIGREGIHAPALFVVGKVVDRSPQLSWFADRPLFGSRILVAGSPDSARRLRARLASLGADAMFQPAIQITDPADWAPVDAAIAAIDEYDWLVFASGNSVERFFGRLTHLGHDARKLGGIRIAAIGSATVDRIRSYHIRPDLAPEKFEAEALARELVEDRGGKRFLLTAAARRNPVLLFALEEAGVEVDDISVYDTVDVVEPDPDVSVALDEGEIDWITITSTTTAESLARCYGDRLKNSRIVSISPLTSKTLRELGYEPDVQASPHTTAGLIRAILEAR